MADTKREIERKFEFTKAKATRRGVPDLTGTAAIAAVLDQGTVDLDAVYYDTPDQRLAADGLTLRRRTGGKDAGWHLKLPVSPGVRDEIQADLSDTVPRSLTALLRSRIRDTGLQPQVRLLSSRRISHLLDADGALLAELSTDTVRAEREEATAGWTEVEVELADGVDPELLDAVEKTFRKAGLRVSDAPSKLARALAETDAEPPARPGPGPADGTAGTHVLSYLREQRDAVIAQDPAVRRNLPDSVHQLRVATRRMRSAFKTYRRVLDRDVTDPIGEELRWLAGELGVDRDQEVLMERLQTRLAEIPGTLALGPVRRRLKVWNATRRSSSRRRALAVLDSKRYLTLLDSLDALLAGPPLLEAAADPAEDVLPKAVLHDYERLAGRVEGALALEPGEERDLAMHDARKAAKRARYAAEAAVPALGKPAKRLGKAVKAVQTLLGDHQDSVVAREALRGLAIQAHGADESAFTWGVLYAREEALAERRERELVDVWAKTSAPGLRAPLGG
ncbi:MULTISPECIES: CYTH and CHAD domain-containing protein [unclassified Streptomyces]|uniref:CYTH and CHAD domain-containing protein n=1 Tax=unclassified Streptomyces TaxID=2593676 RepID=UPI001BE81661|nr:MULTISPECIES: CYTH and CHAD domain-containing protein [unclassified Streptomyces]MBT2404401.1 CYTH and CHAD domain-containing protein [Streptomyces sp. ISL-21]MBT2607048.1 CYTH and CHAD domain-containing protein [Streptomyces sp. ISL-87]